MSATNQPPTITLAEQIEWMRDDLAKRERRHEKNMREWPIANYENDERRIATVRAILATLEGVEGEKK